MKNVCFVTQDFREVLEGNNSMKIMKGGIIKENMRDGMIIEKMTDSVERETMTIVIGIGDTLVMIDTMMTIENNIETKAVIIIEALVVNSDITRIMKSPVVISIIISFEKFLHL